MRPPIALFVLSIIWPTAHTHAGCAASLYGEVVHNGTTTYLTSDQAYGQDTIRMPIGAELKLRIFYNCYAAAAQWYHNDEPFYNTFGGYSSITATEGGVYRLVLVNWHWPVNVDWIVELEDVAVPVTNALSQRNMDLWYDGTSDQILAMVSGTSGQPILLDLIDMHGRILQHTEKAPVPSGEPIRFDIGPIPQGAFIVYMRSGNEQLTRKLARVN